MTPAPGKWRREGQESEIKSEIKLIFSSRVRARPTLAT